MFGYCVDCFLSLALIPDGPCLELSDNSLVVVVVVVVVVGVNSGRRVRGCERVIAVGRVRGAFRNSTLMLGVITVVFYIQ